MNDFINRSENVLKDGFSTCVGHDPIKDLQDKGDETK